MSRIDDLKEQLEYIYALPCPTCGRQWKYQITSDKGWKEIHTCGCPAYYKLIEEREANFYLSKRQENQ
ncbi:MAG: hypothetical protein ACK5M0_03570 [Bacteroidales bacterium]|jgi:hypothetical protein